MNGRCLKCLVLGGVQGKLWAEQGGPGAIFKPSNLVSHGAALICLLCPLSSCLNNVKGALEGGEGESLCLTLECARIFLLLVNEP